MPVTAGTKLGPYEILAPLGAGGMGEVYRAHDSRLGRDVAIKVLLAHLADDPQLRKRFEREARAVSSLSHPHICVLHDIGHEDGIDFLVMEYLEGETLARRLEKGSLPLGQLLTLGIEITDALDKAHKRGITHRDLKPGNIMLTKSGAKLMDFGLAKASDAAFSSASGLSAAATLTTPVTSAGTILGTFHYMSPEQIEGKEADARSDIFSFGAVLYEMATGKRAFEGKSQISVASAILEKDPEPISSIQRTAPPALEQVVRTCLAKNPDDRLQTAHDVKLQLRWIAEGSRAAIVAPRAPGGWRARWPPATLWATAGLAVACALALGFWSGRMARSNLSYGVTRFSIPLANRQELAVDTTLSVALSPDGRKLAYVVAESGVSRLYLRSLDQFDSVVVPESEGTSFPFFSPDSQWVAFYSQGKLNKATVTGGSPIPICASPSFFGGAWTPDDHIIFAAPGLGLASVPAGGGTPQQLKIAGSKQYSPAHPVMLPGNKWVVFTNYSVPGQELVALELATGEVRSLVNSAQTGDYVLGHLLYYSAGAVWSAPFDVKTMSVTGAAVVIARGVDQHNLVGQFSASSTGALAYAPGVAESSGRGVYWVDRKGQARKIDLPAEDYVDPSIASDGKHFVIAVRRMGEQTLAVYDVDRGVLMRMGASGARYAAPTWTPDGKELVFDAAGPTLKLGIYRMPADGSAAPQLVHELAANGHVTSVSSQNQAVVMMNDPATVTDLWLLSMKGDHPLQPFRRTPASERLGSFSPDGRWLAYASNESGRSEIYVEPVPGPGGRTQVSSEGGEQPRWSHNGREIFYRIGTKMMAVAVETKPSLIARKPVELFDVRFDRGGAVPGYDVAPEGQMFLMVKSEQPSPTEIRVVIGWPEELPSTNSPN
jgi:Tol biopolymer transport system component